MSEIQFTVGREVLTGEQLGNNPQILALHGAGLANKDRARPLIERIAKETGQGAFLFDFSGHGKSTGKLINSSLSKRTDEARGAIEFLDKGKKVTLIGFSMGGHIALELLKKYDKIETVILFYPGIYAEDAYSIQFNEQFSEVIRRPESWRTASVLNNLQSFEGNLLIIWGDNDHVIPRGVVDLLLNSATKAKNKELFIVPGGEHLLLPKIYKNEQLYAQLLVKLKQYIS